MSKWWAGVLTVTGSIVFLSLACQPGADSDATVVRVIDGDTIEVRIGLGQELVRLVSVDTPEVRDPVECFGEEASRRTRELLRPGTKVRLQRDVTDRDPFGRLLRYVFLPDGRLLSAVLVAEGYAEVVFYPPDRQHLDALMESERVAWEEGRGLWGAC
ncbi:MAG: thermonuclease family protein [Dehalococcoidia bacterium]|nr:thermonuclease family protein [Dehalococcoidia bacterium]